jgi:hypothetical protein
MFSMPNFLSGTPGEGSLNPLGSILKGYQQGQQIQVQRAALQRALLANQKSQAEQPYWSDQAQANLQLTQGKIPYQQAQTAELQQKTKYTPLELAIKAQNSARENSRFNGAYQLNKTLSEMPQADRSGWIARHPEEYNLMLNNLLEASRTPLPDYITQTAKGLLPQNPQNPMLSQQLQQTQYQDRPVAGKAFQENVNQTDQNNQTNQNNPNTDMSDSDALKYGLQDSANKQATTGQTRQRAEAAVTYEQWLDKNREKYSKAIRTSAKYAGWAGKGQEYLDKLSGSNPDDYNDLVWLKTSFVPNAINQVRRLEGLSSSNKQRQELHETLGALQRFDLDPENALKAFNSQLNTTREISDAVINTAEPRFKGVMRRMAGIKPINGDYVLSDQGVKPSANAKPDKVNILNGKEYHQIGKQWFPVEAK